MTPSQRFGFAVGCAPRPRRTLQEALGDRVDAALEPLRGHFTAPFALDEAGATGSVILQSAEPAFDLAVAFQEAAWPTALRFALVTTPPAGAAGRDEAVRAKAAKVLGRMDKKQTFRFELPNRTDEELLLADGLVRLHRTLTQEWTRARAEAVRSYRRHGRQAEVAEELGVSQQAVSQMLLGARWRDLAVAEAAMRRWLAPPPRTTLWPMRNRVPAQA